MLAVSQNPSDCFLRGGRATPRGLGSQPQRSALVPGRSPRTFARSRLTAVPRLFDLDPCVLDHLAPAFFLATKVCIERFGRLRDHDEALVHAEPLESLGLDGQCG